MRAKRFIWLAVTPILLITALVGCASLPSKEKISRLYGREYRDRHVERVEERHVQVPGTVTEDTQVWFDIYYTTSPDTLIKCDTWKYYHVAEGFIRSSK